MTKQPTEELINELRVLAQNWFSRVEIKKFEELIRRIKPPSKHLEGFSAVDLKQLTGKFRMFIDDDERAAIFLSNLDLVLAALDFAGESLAQLHKT